MGSFRELFSVKEVLNSKGFEVISEGDGSDLLIPIKYLPHSDQDILFEAFNTKASRSEILQKIMDFDFTASNLASLAIINHPKFICDRNSYSTTFEWYIGELLERRFSAFSSSYGIKIGDISRNSISGVTGDYDSIVVLRDINIVYFECKTGSFNRDKIERCLDRSLALHCEFCIMLIQEAINIRSLKACINGIINPLIKRLELFELEIKGKSSSKVIGWNTCFFVTADGDIEDQIRTIMRTNAAKKIDHSNSYGLAPKEYAAWGYTKTILNNLS